MPMAVNEFARSLGIDDSEVRLYLAVREAALHRLYSSVSWLSDRVVTLVAAYANGISVDLSGLQEIAGQFDPSDFQDPGKLQSLQEQVGNLGTFKPTPGQQSAQRALGTLLDLIDGWVETVVRDAIGDRLRSTSAVDEAMRRRRATGGPAEQTFGTLAGLEFRPKRSRSAAEIWAALTAGRGVEGRDALWSHPDLLPSSDDLDSPSAFISGDREFAELMAGLDLSELSEEPDDANPDAADPDAADPDDTNPDAADPDDSGDSSDDAGDGRPV